MSIDNVANHSIEDGVAQEVQTLVVHWLAFLVATSHALVQQCLLVERQVVRVEAQYLVECRKKLLLLSERELYMVNDIVNPHIS